MKEKKQIVNEIKNKSSELPQRIVIDEVFPDGVFRILTAQMKSQAKEADITDLRVWDEEEEYIVSKNELGMLLSEKQLKEIREGQVFSIRQERSKNITDDVKKNVKGRVNVLLDREGKKKETQNEKKQRR
ncbi:MAG: hypothetical protein JSV09_14790 [Thermoplasmata archaeon]|nr:MAG: hypothetical protein JSV09_14790 [Thermoplasmata archaeon]